MGKQLLVGLGLLHWSHLFFSFVTFVVVVVVVVVVTFVTFVTSLMSSGALLLLFRTTGAFRKVMIESSTSRALMKSQSLMHRCDEKRHLLPPDGSMGSFYPLINLIRGH